MHSTQLSLCLLLVCLALPLALSWLSADGCSSGEFIADIAFDVGVREKVGVDHSRATQPPLTVDDRQAVPPVDSLQRTHQHFRPARRFVMCYPRGPIWTSQCYIRVDRGIREFPRDVVGGAEKGAEKGTSAGRGSRAREKVRSKDVKAFIYMEQGAGLWDPNRTCMSRIVKR